MSREAYDYVIVGGGPAANPETRVLLLEAESARSSLGVRLPARFTKLVRSPAPLGVRQRSPRPR